MNLRAHPFGSADHGALSEGPVSLEPYRSAEFFELERERVFGRAWLLVGRVEEVAKPGDYLVKQVEIASASILIARGSDGELRAFHNVCPHRANQLVWDNAGSTKVFVCPYHSWSFGNDGALRGVPDREMFPGLNKDECHLTRVALETWDGWIFINLAAQPEMSLDTFLGSFKSYFEGVHYINADRPVTIETRLKCNWKVVMDAFAEAYHIPTLHQATLKTMFANSDNAYGRPLQTSFHGPHAVNSMFGNPDYVPQSKQVLEQLVYDPSHVAPDHAADIAAFMAHRSVNPTKTRSWSMDVNYIFPNTHIDANVNGFFVHQFWPISVNETRHEARFYLRTPRNIRERLAQEHMIAHSVDIILEDVSNVERTQRGINSRATSGMHISQSEVLIRHSLGWIRAWAENEGRAPAASSEARP